jgi:glycosyltransferase involved in cell wall biosynthesis
MGLESYIKFFKEKFSNYILLEWKFPHAKGNVNSRIEIYINKQLRKAKTLISPPVFVKKFFYFIFLPFSYLYYFIRTIFLLFNVSKCKINVFFGINYFCTFCGIILKFLGRVDVVIYRVMDFFPLPPSGIYRFLNRIFYIIDRFCLKHSDYIIFTTVGHVKGREKYGYFNRKNYKFKYLPLGINSKEIINLDMEKRTQNSLVYCGVLSKYHQLNLIFDVIMELRETYPDLIFRIIGSGPDKLYYERLVEKKEIQKNVKFFGYLEENRKFEKIMSKSKLGIALYKEGDGFMKYTEPAKVKYYLKYGVPAIISDVPEIASELHDKNVSFKVSNKKNDIKKIIKNFFKSKKMQTEYSENIRKFSSSVDVKKMLESVLKEIFIEIDIIKE